MGSIEDARLLGWLSRLDEAEPEIPLEDPHRPPLSTIKGFHSYPAGQQYLPVAEYQQGLRLEDFERQPRSLKDVGHDQDKPLWRKEKNGYKRLPRYKTKEDRYEYKMKPHPTAHEPTANDVKKPSTKKRKHSVNDSFHASKVPRNRLTLKSSVNLGFFNRGKISFPVNTRALVDVGFSEVDFLSGPQAHKKGSVERHEGIGMGPASRKEGTHRVPEAQYSISDSFREEHQGLPGPCSHNGVYRDSLLAYGEPLFTHSQKGDDEGFQDSSRNSFESIMKEADLKPPPGHSQSRKTTPDPFPEVHIEPYPMQLLDFDLNASNICDAQDPTKKYWTLEELKNLLIKRSLLWKSLESGILEQGTSPSRIESRKRKRNSNSEIREDIRKSPMEKRMYELEQSTENASETEIITPIHPATILDQPSFPRENIDLAWHNNSHASTEWGKSIQSTRPQPHHRPCLVRETGFRYAEDGTWVSQAIDAAYDVIMQSEIDSPHKIPNYAGWEVSSTGNHGEITSSLQDYRRWGCEDEQAFRYVPIGQEFPIPHGEWPRQLMDTGADSQSYRPVNLEESSADREALFSAAQLFVLESEDGPSINLPEPSGLNVCAHALEGFWRQNKLY